MSNPFPGMNPYLEHPELWPEVHNRLIVAIADALAPQILPKYRVNIEKRVYQANDENSLLVGIPDIESNNAEATRERSHVMILSAWSGD